MDNAFDIKMTVKGGTIEIVSNLLSWNQSFFKHNNSAVATV
jgi:hypothetical protein